MANHSAATKLHAIVVMRGLSQAGAARELGIARCYLSLILSGKKRPGQTLSNVIAAWTDGDVPASAWMTPDELRRVANASRRPSTRPRRRAA